MNENGLNYRLIEGDHEQLELFPVDAARIAELERNHDLVLSAARGPYYRKADEAS